MVEGTRSPWRGSMRDRGAERAGQRLEAGLGDVVVVLAVEVLDVEREAAVLGEGLEELAEQLGVEIADLVAAEGDLPDEIGPAGDVDRAAGQRLVHRQVDVAIAGDAGAVAQRLAKRLAERDADILGGVVLVDVEVALRRDADVDQAVARELLQHVVEEADAGRDLGLARAVEGDGDDDVGLLGLPRDLCCAHGGFPGAGEVRAGF